MGVFHGTQVSLTLLGTGTPLYVWVLHGPS